MRERLLNKIQNLDDYYREADFSSIYGRIVRVSKNRTRSVAGNILAVG